MKKKIIVTIITVVVLSLGVFGFMQTGQTKGAAKRTLESYLTAMKQGDTDKANKYLEIDVDNLIDVFNYDYLSTLDEKEVKNKSSITALDFQLYPEIYSKHGYDSFPEYVQYIRDTFGDDPNYVVEEPDDETIEFYKKGDTSKQYTFLYNMQIANGLGNKLYKKVEFTLKWDKNKDGNGAFEITDITIR